MHILILNHPSLEIDHKNLNGLDNRRLNLRPATPSQNQRNSTTSRGNKSGYKGVSFYKREAKWGAMSKNNGKAKWLGYFDSAIEAAKAYNDFVKKIEPEFARLNRV